MQRCISQALWYARKNIQEDHIHPSFILPRHLRNAYALDESLSWYLSGSAGESYNKGKAAWIFMPRSEKAFPGIMSARHTLFDLPPERQYSGNHSSLSIQGTMAFGGTFQDLPEATLVPRTSLPLGDILAVDKIALASQRNFQSILLTRAQVDSETRTRWQSEARC